jgi:hypothetical protein
MLSIRTFLRPNLLKNIPKFCRLVHNQPPIDKMKTVIYVKGIDSTSTKISPFNKIIHKFTISLSLIKKIIVCIILYIMMDSIFIPIYNFKQNANKWRQENKIEFKL